MCFDLIYSEYLNTRIFHSTTNWTRYDQKHLLVFMQSRPTLYSCQILIKLEFCGQIFEKYSNIEFHENSSSGSQKTSKKT
jgi:hypothetical protein